MSQTPNDSHSKVAHVFRTFADCYEKRELRLKLHDTIPLHDLMKLMETVVVCCALMGASETMLGSPQCPATTDKG